MHTSCEVLIIGGGIAGLSLASELAQRRGTGDGVVLVESEATLAHHTSGRSAQQLILGYGPPPVQELTRLTVAHLLEPTPAPPRPVAWPARTVVIGTAEQLRAEATPISTPLTRAQVLELCPTLSPMPQSVLEGGLLEEASVRTDAPALLEWHRSRAVADGVRILTSAPVTGAHHNGHEWTVNAGEHQLQARQVVNAAGSWADRVAELFGAAPLGLRPLRRTAALVRLEQPLDPAHPMVVTAEDGWYFRPDPEGALLSPSEAVEAEPGDAQPHPGDVERLVAEVDSLTSLGITEVIRSWTGLRTEAADGVPVCGFDAKVPGLLWLAGQTGYGFQTSWGMARAASDLLVDGAVGPWCTPETVEALDPARFTRG